MEQYSFFNSKDGDRRYNARHWADYFAPLFKSGVFNGGLQVTANDDMTVTINEGYAWIDGYAYHLTEPITKDIETASGNMNRKDNIVIRLDLTNRWIMSDVVTGTYYSGTATAKDPEITSTVHELVIARINMAAGTTEIKQNMIEDTRMNSALCGWVTGAVDQIDFEQITAQFEEFFKQYQSDIQTEFKNYQTEIASLETQGRTAYEDMKAEFEAYEKEQIADFEAYVESIKDILDGNVAGNLILLIEQCMLKTVYKTKDDGTAYLEIEDNLNMAIAGFTAKETFFNDDGTITEIDGMGNIKTTTFVSQTEISEEYQFASGERYTKTTTFNGKNISERIVKHE